MIEASATAQFKNPRHCKEISAGDIAIYWAGLSPSAKGVAGAKRL